MEMDRYEPGVPSWVDLGSPDPAGAAEFYGALFGWDAPEGPPEAGGYRIATVGDRRVAGIGPATNPGPPVWATYVNVESADETAAKVRAAGGQVLVEPMDVLDVGRMAVFVDPVGAVFSVWQPGTHPGAELVNEPGTWSWSELVTTDTEASKSFYADVFGWTPSSQDAGPMGEYTEWQIGGRSVGGMMPKPPQMPAEVPPHWNVYFAVEDTDRAVARVTELGGAVVMPPMDIEPGRFAVVSDPTGATFNVIALSPARAGS
jgi:predicted enzyme related to lactoylglutathione lyase